MHIRLVRGLVYAPPPGKLFYWMITYWTREDEVESTSFSERPYHTHAEAQIAMLGELNRLLRP